MQINLVAWYPRFRREIALIAILTCHADRRRTAGKFTDGPDQSQRAYERCGTVPAPARSDAGEAWTALVEDEGV